MGSLSAIPCENELQYSRQIDTQVILHNLDQGNRDYAADPRYGKSMNYTDIYEPKMKFFSPEYYTKISSRFYWVKFDTEKLNRKQEEFPLLSFVPDKEEFRFIDFSHA